MIQVLSSSEERKKKEKKGKKEKRECADVVSLTLLPPTPPCKRVQCELLPALKGPTVFFFQRVPEVVSRTRTCLSVTYCRKHSCSSWVLITLLLSRWVSDNRKLQQFSYWALLSSLFHIFIFWCFVLVFFNPLFIYLYTFWRAVSSSHISIYFCHYYFMIVSALC